MRDVPHFDRSRRILCEKIFQMQEERRARGEKQFRRLRYLVSMGASFMSERYTNPCSLSLASPLAQLVLMHCPAAGVSIMRKDMGSNQSDDGS